MKLSSFFAGFNVMKYAQRALAAVGVLALLLGGGFAAGVKYEHNKMAARALADAKKIEDRWQETFNSNVKVLANEITARTVQRDAALKRVRDYANRVSASAGHTQSGSSGQGLDWRYGEAFDKALIAFAYDASAQQAKLKECYDDLDAVRARRSRFNMIVP